MSLLLLLNPKEGWSAYPRGDDVTGGHLKKKKKRKKRVVYEFPRDETSIPREQFHLGFKNEEERTRTVKKRKKVAAETFLWWMMNDD